MLPSANLTTHFPRKSRVEPFRLHNNNGRSSRLKSTKFPLNGYMTVWKIPGVFSFRFWVGNNRHVDCSRNQLQLRLCNGILVEVFVSVWRGAKTAVFEQPVCYLALRKEAESIRPINKFGSSLQDGFHSNRCASTLELALRVFMSRTKFCDNCGSWCRKCRTTSNCPTVLSTERKWGGWSSNLSTIMKEFELTFTDAKINCSRSVNETCFKRGYCWHKEWKGAHPKVWKFNVGTPEIFPGQLHMKQLTSRVI